MTLELRLLDEVRQARVADPQSYVEGQNPYRIRYAVYNLRNPKIVAALADAADAGVDVQVLIEADQLDPSRDWNTADETLVQRGFELAPDHRQLDAQARISADLIGIVDGGLMHLKTRIFETPASRKLLSGSLNPGDNAIANEETLHLINDQRLIDRYVAAYEAVLRGQRIDNAWDEGEAVNVLFTPAANGLRAAAKTLQWLEQEQEQVLLMVFSLRDVSAPGISSSLVEILARKVADGVPVYVITDRKQSDGVDADGNPLYWNDGTEDRLRAAGVHVYEATNRASPYTAMHHKAAVLGRTSIRVITDAANWTRAGLGTSTKLARNVESQLFIDSAKLDGNRTGRRYLAQWLKVLQRYAPQSAAIDGEPGFEAVSAQLASAADWPAQQVTFVAEQAYTSWGESIQVRGDRPELGAWGPGVALEPTDYPTWRSPAVEMPLGASFEWKLAAAYGEAELRWESGSNRRDRAAPACLVPGSLTLRAAWR